MLFDEPLLNTLQGTMATIDPYSVKKEAIDEYRIDTIEERLTRIEDKVDLLITQLKIKRKLRQDTSQAVHSALDSAPLRPMMAT